MQIIEPYSPDLRNLKAKAIIELDKPLLSRLQEVEGREFIYCHTFLSLLMASSDESNELPIVEGSELSEALKSL